MRLRFVLPLFLLITVSTADQIKVVAASDLNYLMHEIAARFERETGNKVALITGSSGNFYAQILSGAPFDVFFSADIEYPQKLESAGLAEKGSLYEYATGKIVLWVPNASKLDLGKGLAALLDPSVRRIAIANPAHAPYGRAAVAALRSEGLYDKLNTKLVFGENISQAAQFVQSGNADAGILALSLALAPEMKSSGRYVAIPESEYPPIRQAAIIVSSSKSKATARLFLDFLRKPEIVKLMDSYGFVTPQK